MAEFSLVDGYHRIRGSFRLRLFVFAKRTHRKRHYLLLSTAWELGLGRTPNPDELGPLASLHKNLAADSISTPEMEKPFSAADIFYKSSGNFVIVRPRTLAC